MRADSSAATWRSISQRPARRSRASATATGRAPTRWRPASRTGSMPTSIPRASTCCRPKAGARTSSITSRAGPPWGLRSPIRSRTSSAPCTPRSGCSTGFACAARACRSSRCRARRSTGRVTRARSRRRPPARRIRPTATTRRSWRRCAVPTARTSGCAPRSCACSPPTARACASRSSGISATGWPRRRATSCSTAPGRSAATGSTRAMWRGCSRWSARRLPSPEVPVVNGGDRAGSHASRSSPSSCSRPGVRNERSRFSGTIAGQAIQSTSWPTWRGPVRSVSLRQVALAQGIQAYVDWFRKSAGR